MKAISVLFAFALLACGGGGHEPPAAPQPPAPVVIDDTGPMPPRLRIASAYESTPYDDGDLSGVEADGRSMKEACAAAKEECQRQLGDCEPERVKVKRTCSCYKGGVYERGYTCAAECSCKAPGEPIS